MNFYKFIFYTIYNSIIKRPGHWWPVVKTMFVMLALELWVFVSIYLYYEIITKKQLFSGLSTNPISYGIVIVLTVLKLYIFEYDDRWKEQRKVFNKWSRKKKRNWGIAVWTIAALILINLLFSFFLFSRVDWNKYA